MEDGLTTCTTSAFRSFSCFLFLFSSILFRSLLFSSLLKQTLIMQYSNYTKVLKIFPAAKQSILHVENDLPLLAKFCVDDLNQSETSME